MCLKGLLGPLVNLSIPTPSSGANLIVLGTDINTVNLYRYL